MLKPFPEALSNERFSQTYKKPTTPITIWVSGGLRHPSTEITLKKEDGSILEFHLTHEDVELLILQLQS